jgi:hypothetical protein
MPLQVPKEVGRLARNFRQLGTLGSPTERRFLAAVRDELKPEIRKMYATSSDPFGSPWTRKVGGGLAYQSKKMGNAVGMKRVPGGLSVRDWIKWIRAADEGHTYPARRQTNFLDHRGRLIRQRIFARREERAHGRASQAFKVAADRIEDHSLRARVGRFLGLRQRAVADPLTDRKLARRLATINAKRGSAIERHVGARVLPPRRQQPNGRMPDGWGEAINRGTDKGMGDFLKRATGDGS